MHPEKRKYFKRSRRILLSHYSKLSKENKDALEIMLKQSSDLATAYYLKEQFYDFMQLKDRATAYTKLRKFIISTTVSELKEFRKRNAYGYRNFDNFRNRTLLSLT